MIVDGHDSPGFERDSVLTLGGGIDGFFGQIPASIEIDSEADRRAVSRDNLIARNFESVRDYQSLSPSSHILAIWE